MPVTRKGVLVNKFFPWCAAFIAFFLANGCELVNVRTNLGGVAYGKPLEVVNSSDFIVNVKIAGVRPLLWRSENEWTLTEKGQSLSISLRDGNRYDSSSALVFRAWRKSGEYVGVGSVEGIRVSRYANYGEVFTITEEGIAKCGYLICRWQ